MKQRGFTLIELLGVIIILSIIMLIAVPNVSSMLERTKRDNYIADARKFVSLVEYELRKGGINKPSSTELLKISLRYLNTNDIESDPDNVEYDVNNSFVVVSRQDGYLVYYVNLMSTVNSKNKVKGISLVNVEDLEKDDKYKKIKTYDENSVPKMEDSDIISKVGISATIISYN